MPNLKYHNSPKARRALKLVPEMVKVLKCLRKDCAMALDGRWDRSDDGFEAMQMLIDQVLEKAEKI